MVKNLDFGDIVRHSARNTLDSNCQLGAHQAVRAYTYSTSR
jgi:hypothetical protein